MKKILLIVILSMLTLNVKSQKTFDYLKHRSEFYVLSCGNTTKLGSDTSFRNLLKIDSNTISNGLYEYYHDLAMCYYDQGLYNDSIREACFNECIILYKRNLNLIKNDSGSLDQLAFFYDVLNNKEEAKKYLILYKKYTKRKYWDNDLINQIEGTK